mmetsp:Transcript_23657/g.58466  ORF Transcript_23657/g.58466 Transcript_23657/m.58466 type:complete len:146 (-) Transcript_23657:345-782(-)
MAAATAASAADHVELWRPSRERPVALLGADRVKIAGLTVCKQTWRGRYERLLRIADSKLTTHDLDGRLTNCWPLHSLVDLRHSAVAGAAAQVWLRFDTPLCCGRTAELTFSLPCTDAQLLMDALRAWPTGGAAIAVEASERLAAD